MVLYRQHSDYIQQTLVSARKRTFKDAISTLANDLASDQELNSNMCILGEVLNREEKKLEQKDDKATNDSEKNAEQIGKIVVLYRTPLFGNCSIGEQACGRGFECTERSRPKPDQDRKDCKAPERKLAVSRL